VARSRFLAFIAGLLALCACEADRPDIRPERDIPIDTLRDRCEQGSAFACDWVGVRDADSGDRRGAIVAYRRSCESGKVLASAACWQIYVLASGGTGAKPSSMSDAHMLDPAFRAEGLSVACHRGVLEACELLLSETAHDTSLKTNLQRLGWLVDGCRRARDQASCVQLGMAYDTTQLGGVQVLAARDAVHAADLYDSACISLHSDNVKNDGEEVQTHHLSPEVGRAALETMRTGCELAGDHAQAGDGVAASPSAALRSYRECTTLPSCRAKYERLRASDPQLAARDAEWDAEDEREQDQSRADREREREEQREQDRADAAREEREQERLEQNRARLEEEREADRQRSAREIQQTVDSVNATQQAFSTMQRNENDRFARQKAEREAERREAQKREMQRQHDEAQEVAGERARQTARERPSTDDTPSPASASGAVPARSADPGCDYRCHQEFDCQKCYDPTMHGHFGGTWKEPCRSTCMDSLQSCRESCNSTGNGGTVSAH